MPKTSKKEPTTDGLEILRRRYYAGKPERAAEYEKISADMDVARKVFQLREIAGLTQRQLAQRIGTTQSVIARLEDADYGGHSLAMLKRVAAALDQRVEIRFVPVGNPRAPTGLAGKKRTPQRAGALVRNKHLASAR